MIAVRAIRAWLGLVAAVAILTAFWPIDPDRIGQAPAEGSERVAALQAHRGAASASLLVELARATPDDAQSRPLRLAALAEAHAAAPRDLDIADALAQARLAYPDATPPALPPATLGLWTADGWGLLAAALWLVASGLATDVRSRRSAVGIGLLACFVSAIWVRAVGDDPRGRIGVVALADHGLRALPDLAEPPSSPVPVGSEVIVLQTGVDFCRVRTGLGEEGWLSSGALHRATTP